MSWRPPPMVKPGPLSRTDADNLNRWLIDVSRFLGGITAAPPLQAIQDRSGVRFTLSAPSLANVFPPSNTVIQNTNTANIYVTNTTNTANLYLQSLFITGYPSVSLTAGNYSNYALTASKLILNGTNTANFSGFGYITNTQAPPDGFQAYIVNNTNQPAVLMNLANTSAANMQIQTPLNSGYTIWPNAEVGIEYVAALTKWLIFTQTFGAGGGSLATYGCQELLFGSGLAYTDHANGTATVTGTGVGFTVPTPFKNASLNYSLTNAFANTGASITLPDIGTYLVWAQCEISVAIVSSVQAKLRTGGGTDIGIIGNTQNPTNGGSISLQIILMAEVITTGVNSTVVVQAQSSGAGVGTVTGVEMVALRGA